MIRDGFRRRKRREKQILQLKVRILINTMYGLFNYDARVIFMGAAHTSKAKWNRHLIRTLHRNHGYRRRLRVSSPISNLNSVNNIIVCITKFSKPKFILLFTRSVYRPLLFDYSQRRKMCVILLLWHSIRTIII